MLITSNRDYYRLCDRIAKLPADTPLGLDTETTGVDLWTRDVLRGVCVAFQGESYYVPVSHPDSWNVPDTSFLRRALEACEALPVYANAPFDWRSLEAGLGFRPPMDRYRDVQLISWLEDENAPKALKKMGARFFGEDEAAEQRHLKKLFGGETQQNLYKALRSAEMFLAEQEGRKPEPAAETRERAKALVPETKKSWATVTAEDIAAYAAHDADLTVRVYEHLLRQREYAEIEPAVQKLHDVQAAAYRMTRRGVAVDAGRAEALRQDALDEATIAASEFDVNIASAKQLAALIYETWDLPVTERTDGGAPSTAAAVLESMAGQHPGLDRILEYRALVKAAQFYAGLLEHVDSAGRVHPGFNVIGTVTGRWSCSDPNLQQIPKENKNPHAKKLFVAAPGYELVGFDLKSAELFVGASIAGDEDMMAALTEEGRSFHKETAAGVFGSDEEPFYTLAKNLNYGIPYGIGPKKFATYIAKGRRERQSPSHYRQAKDAIDAHRASWPKLHAAIENCTMWAEVNGRLPLGWPGAFRHFVSPTMDWPVPSYQAFNAAVQGGVARFVNDVLLAIEGPAAELDAVPLLAVHDSLVFEVPAGGAGALEALLQAVSDGVNPFQMRMLWDMKEGV